MFGAMRVEAAAPTCGGEQPRATLSGDDQVMDLEFFTGIRSAPWRDEGGRDGVQVLQPLRRAPRGRWRL